MPKGHFSQSASKGDNNFGVTVVGELISCPLAVNQDAELNIVDRPGWIREVCWETCGGGGLYGFKDEESQGSIDGKTSGS